MSHIKSEERYLFIFCFVDGGLDIMANMKKKNEDEFGLRQVDERMIILVLFYAKRNEDFFGCFCWGCKIKFFSDWKGNEVCSSYLLRLQGIQRLKPKISDCNRCK